MSMVMELGVTLRDFMPLTEPRLVAAGRSGPKCIISDRLLAALKIYAAQQGISIPAALRQLQDEVHQ